MTVAWIHGETRAVWFPGLVVTPPAGLLATQLPGVEIHVGNHVDPVPAGPLVAHNAWGFDSHVWKAKTGQDREWIDTEPLARACGLPGGIDKIGERLRGAGKHKEGKARLLKFCKSDSKRPGVGDLCMIAKYNLDDVEILKLAYEYVSARPQTPTEAKVLRTHKRINDRGIRVDLKLCQQIATLSEVATARTVADIATATNGSLGSLDDLRSRTKVFDWVASQQASVGKSLRKDALETLFRENEEDDVENEETGVRLTPLVRRVLTQRFSALRITGAKVTAALKAAYHGRLHEILVYYGAHTGRWAGRRVQPQNLPRPKPGIDPWKILETDLSAEAVLSVIPPTATLDDAVSGLLRSIFIPDDGYFFAAADYNAIEARVLAWLAGEEKLLESFRAGTCPYLAMASKLYGEPITDKKDPRRQVGKVVVLGCGYQLGETKMGLYALAQGIDLDAAGVTPSAAVNAYRDQFPMIAGEMTDRGYRRGGLWNELNYAAIKACTTGKAEYRNLGFRHDGRDLRMILPSGRALFYPNARVEEIVPVWGGMPKKSVVCKSTFGIDKVMYGGKWAENCWAGDTLILTANGVKPIIEVSTDDCVWDGKEWVSHDGVVNQGYQETGEWLGTRVTADHLMTDGSTWRSVIASDEAFTRQCLKWAASSVDSRLSGQQRKGITRKQSVYASVGTVSVRPNENYFGRQHPSATPVFFDAVVKPGKPNWPVSFPTTTSEVCGRTGTRGSKRGGITRNLSRGTTTEPAVFVCATSGLRTPASSIPTQKPWTGGNGSTLTSTELTTTVTTSRVISGALRDQQMLRTPGTLGSSRSPGNPCPPWKYGEGTVRSGPKTPLITTSVKVKPEMRLWHSTGRHETVYDLKNCGPRHRYTVITSEGPVVVHNCTQAVARDPLAEALVTADAEGIFTPLHVHDEGVAQVSTQAEAKVFTEIMARKSPWAEGLPLSVECDTMPRYAKSPPKGWSSYVAKS